MVKEEEPTSPAIMAINALKVRTNTLQWCIGTSVWYYNMCDMQHAMYRLFSGHRLIQNFHDRSVHTIWITHILTLPFYPSIHPSMQKPDRYCLQCHRYWSWDTSSSLDSMIRTRRRRKERRKLISSWKATTSKETRDHGCIGLQYCMYGRYPMDVIGDIFIRTMERNRMQHILKNGRKTIGIIG